MDYDMNPDDRHVLSTIARLARGTVIQTPPVGDADIPGRITELPGGVESCGAVPQLLLEIECRDLRDNRQLRGAIAALTGRGLLQITKRMLRLPPGTCTYEPADGTVWSLTARTAPKAAIPEYRDYIAVRRKDPNDDLELRSAMTFDPDLPDLVDHGQLIGAESPDLLGCCQRRKGQHRDCSGETQCFRPNRTDTAVWVHFAFS